MDVTPPGKYPPNLKKNGTVRRLKRLDEPSDEEVYEAQLSAERSQEQVKIEAILNKIKGSLVFDPGDNEDSD